MKVIFLDIDGVLNCNTSNSYAPSGCIGVSDKFIKRLKKIVSETGAKIVLSSDWKLAEDQDYTYLTQKLWHKGGIRVFAQTPNLSWQMRGQEINEWLSANDVEQYIILDDILFKSYFYYDGLTDHLLLTDPEVGLTDENVEDAIAFLNKKEE